MKKLLLLTFMLVSSYQLFAFSTQGKWRWRKDDGTEKTATWFAAENTAIIINNTDEPLRLRINLYNSGSGGFLDDAQFEDSSNLPGAVWTMITNSAGTNAFVLAGTSPNVTDQEETTKQTTGQGGVFGFVPGLMIVSTEKLPSFTINKNKETEYEYCIKATSNIQPGVTYYFRVAAADYPPGQPLPSLTTAAVLPICFASFTISAEGKKAKVEWVTSCEKNNSYFDVERSNDGANWTKVTSVKAKSNSTEAVTYTAYDNGPLNGTNFYRIKQYDIDGKSSVSVVRSLKMHIETASLLNVYPNPVREKINFSLQQVNAQNALVTLHNISGKLIHSESLKTVSTNTTYTLQMKTKPAPGVYILTLKATGVAESIRVVVE